MADIERQKYTYTPYTESDAVSALKGLQTEAETAYNTHINNGFTYSQDQAHKDAMNAYLNRDKFSYDINGDALYQQYKDKYIQQGKMAMADTMGQAAAMTGGYGNSYAASVGNQAYQASLQQLNDVIPELYQMAYDRYNQEGQDLLNQYSLLSTDRDAEYGMWKDRGNQLDSNRTYYGTEYNNAYNREYAEHTTTEGFKYQDVADANAAAQWQANYDLALDQFELQKAQTGASKGSNGTYTVPTTPSYLTDYDEIEKWSDRISEAQTEEEALKWVEQLEKIDPELADRLYSDWLYYNSKGPGIVDTSVKGTGGYRGGGGGDSRHEIHLKN